MATTYNEDGSSSTRVNKTRGKNPVLDPIKKRLLDENNVAPAATFIKRQQRLKDLLKEYE